MKKILGLILSACILSVGGIYAQSEIDAYKLSEKDINGTARYLSMGGAFGALGGDISSMYNNPAGLGIYRSSEVVSTVSLNFFNTNSSWKGPSVTGNKTRFNLDNFAYVGYFPTGNDDGVVGFNFGVSYNKLKNFNRQYTLNGTQEYNMSEYALARALGENLTSSKLTQNDKYDPYFTDPPISWLPILGFEGGFLYTPPGTNDLRSTFEGLSANNTSLHIREWGGIDEYNFSFATNISNIFFIGATFGVTDINYRMSSLYDEKFGTEYLSLENHLSTDGTGYNVNIGAIVRPVDFLRLGVAYNSPTWYKMTDYFHATAESYLDTDNAAIRVSTPSHTAADYRLRTPDRWIFSAAAILGQSGLISVDYELTNYKNIHLSDVDGYAFIFENQEIRRHTQNMHTIKVGGEYKVTPQFALRAGGYWQSSYANSLLQDNQEQIYTAGTVPHFNVDKGIASVSVGFGYRFTPNFYLDMAYVYKQRKENAYTFSSTDYGSGIENVVSEAASLKTNTSRVALTLGYKF